MFEWKRIIIVKKGERLDALFAIERFLCAGINGAEIAEEALGLVGAEAKVEDEVAFGQIVQSFKVRILMEQAPDAAPADAAAQVDMK